VVGHPGAEPGVAEHRRSGGHLGRLTGLHVQELGAERDRPSRYQQCDPDAGGAALLHGIGDDQDDAERDPARADDRRRPAPAAGAEPGHHQPGDDRCGAGARRLEVVAEECDPGGYRGEGRHDERGRGPGEPPPVEQPAGHQVGGPEDQRDDAQGRGVGLIALAGELLLPGDRLVAAGHERALVHEGRLEPGGERLLRELERQQHDRHQSGAQQQRTSPRRADDVGHQPHQRRQGQDPLGRPRRDAVAVEGQEVEERWHRQSDGGHPRGRGRALGEQV
jgi:hypothetical protein